MVKITRSFKRQKLRRRRIEYSKSNISMMLFKVKGKRKIKSKKSFIIGKKLKRRLAFLYYRYRRRKAALKLYFKKMILIELDLGIRKYPKKIKKKIYLQRYRHLIRTPKFLPQMLYFIFTYPFTARIIAKVFNISLDPNSFIFKTPQKFLNFIDLAYKVKYRTELKKYLTRVKRQRLKDLIKKIMKKNILNSIKKRVLALDKGNRLVGRNYRGLVKKKKLKFRHRGIFRVKKYNYILKKLNKKDLKNKLNVKKQNKTLIRLFFILSQSKKNIKDKSVEKNLNKNKIKYYKNPLDFFYNKHIEEIEAYCFK